MGTSSLQSPSREPAHARVRGDWFALSMVGRQAADSPEREIFEHQVLKSQLDIGRSLPKPS